MARLIALFAWLGSHVSAVLVMVALLAGGLLGFALLADEVREGDTRSFDEAVLLALRNPADRSDPVGPLWLEEAGRDITALGSFSVLMILTLSAAGYLLLSGKRRATLFLLGSIAGGQGLSSLLKLFFHRPRPDLVPHGAYVYTASFPSGHAMMSAVTFLTLAALLARVQPRLRLKAYLLVLALLLTLLVGLSRLYLGVHWPTDVLAGWTAGACWALLCWLTAGWLQRRGQVEKAGDADQDQPQAGPEGQ